MQDNQTTPNQSSPLTRKKGGRVWIIVLVVLAMIFGGIGYVGYVIVKKVEAVYHEAKDAITSKTQQTNVAEDKPMAVEAPCTALDAATRSDVLAAESHAVVPLVPDLVLANVWTVRGKDLETLISVKSVNEQAVQSTNSGPTTTISNGEMTVNPSTVFPLRSICQTDLLTAHVLETETRATDPPVIAQTTHISVSREVFDDLKAGKKTVLDYREDYRPVGDGYSWFVVFKGEIELDAGGSKTFHVIVNDKEVDLPVIRASGHWKDAPTEFAILDDRGNPLVLDVEMPAKKFAIKVSKINYPVAKSIENDLAKEGKTAIYGIYFDFNSAVIRAESEPVLKEIAEAMKSNAAWKLNIAGHTDSVGGEASNLTLSKNRAEAVKKALMERYSIDASRLSTSGYGASQPKATNDTVEGRALNRRVELVRQ